MIAHRSVADTLATYSPGRASDEFVAGINWTRLGEEITGPTLEIEKRQDGSESETGDGFVSADELLANPTLLEPPRVVLPFLAYYARTTVLSGSWKCGKSTLTAQAVAQAVIARQARRDFLGESVPRGSWLWMALDEPLADLWRRLHGFGLTEPGASIGFYDHQRPTLTQLADRLDLTHADGLVIDSLTNYARGLVTDAKQAAEWEALFSDLASVTAPRERSWRYTIRPTVVRRRGQRIPGRSAPVPMWSLRSPVQTRTTRRRASSPRLVAVFSTST